MAGLIDAVAIGEGEETLLSMYEAVSRGETDAAIAGTMRCDRNGRTQITPRKPLRVSSLPTPDFSQMQVPSYQDPMKGTRLPYQLSRGCTDKCTFCSEWVFWRHFRPGSAEQAVSQIDEMIRRYGLTQIAFTDSLLNGHMNRLRQFAEFLVARSVKVSWGGFMRAEMDRETAELLKRSGCKYAFIGVESMSDTTLDAMNKRRTEADNISALRTFLEAGIPVRAGIIPGFPADTRDRLLHTARVLIEMTKQYSSRLTLNVEPFIVSPGQPLYSKLDEMGLRGIGWPDDILNIAPTQISLVGAPPCRVLG